MSITIWNRIEPRTREGKKIRGKDDKTPDPLLRGLQAQVRDPLWFLTRQFQTGEFRGEDTGSPIQASIQLTVHGLGAIRIPQGGPPVPLGGQGNLPVEVRSERAPVRLKLRGSIQLGLRVEALVRALALSDAARDARLQQLRQAYPVNTNPAADDVTDSAADRFRLLAATRVTDGEALYAEAAAAMPNLPAALQAGGMSAAEWQTVLPAVQDFIAYRRSLYSEPAPDTSAWNPRDLRHTFELEATTLATTLIAPEFEGGHLDWYDFTAAPTAQAPIAAAAPLEEWTFIPNPVTFRGVPKMRWWTLDDRRTDYGALDVQHTDLARLLLAEFALLFSEDWFQLPLRLPSGSLSTVNLLVVTDTFGERTLIPPTQRQVPAGESPWSMFVIAGAPAVAEALFLPPKLGTVLDGETLEEVNFFRDEMASMGWAVERTLQGPMDAPISGYASYLERLRVDPPLDPPKRQPGGPEVYYELGTTVPDNWIPLVPVSGGPRAHLFRRGLMQRPGAGGLEDVKARGELLDPAHKPFYVADEAVPRAGVRVIRRFRHARGVGGETYLWVGRRVSVGRGQGASGLAFDVVRLLAEP